MSKNIRICITHVHTYALTYWKIIQIFDLHFSIQLDLTAIRNFGPTLKFLFFKNVRRNWWATGIQRTKMKNNTSDCAEIFLVYPPQIHLVHPQNCPNLAKCSKNPTRYELPSPANKNWGGRLGRVPTMSGVGKIPSPTPPPQGEVRQCTGILLQTIGLKTQRNKSTMKKLSYLVN